MAENVEKTIDGHTYEISPFMGMRGWKIQMKLGKMIGPSIKEALGALPKGQLQNILEGEIDPAMFGGAITAFIDAVAEGDPDGKFVAELLSQTQRDGVVLSENQINKIYAANYIEMAKALVAVVVANGFFGLGDTGLDLGALVAASPESSTSKSKKSGRSGGS